MESESQTPSECLEKFTEQDTGVPISKDKLLFPVSNQSWRVSQSWANRDKEVHSCVDFPVPASSLSTLPLAERWHLGVACGLAMQPPLLGRPLTSQPSSSLHQLGFVFQAST